MCANSQSNWLNTIAVRASYILPILKRFPWWKPRKTGGWSISPRKKPKQKPVCLLSFEVDPLNWQSFIEIGEMACSQICGDGSIFVSRFGPGGPNLGWSKSARTPGRHIESFEVLPAIQQSSYPANSSSSRPPRSKSAGGYGPPHIQGGSVSAIFISYWI